jgi:hypothetical protein
MAPNQRDRIAWAGTLGDELPGPFRCTIEAFRRIQPESDALHIVAIALRLEMPFLIQLHARSWGITRKQTIEVSWTREELQAHSIVAISTRSNLPR